ncbi:MAG: hypothetical protein CL424_17865 [Acidimicrobiaceae bacterium]|nr:hypothetical protein [Acidimicrobiaceae bacterium]
MAQAIYREWFVHFRFPGHESTTFKDSSVGRIPEDWDVFAFSDVATFTNGFAFKPSHFAGSGWPVIKIKEMNQGVRPDTPRADPADIKEKYWLATGDLLFSWSANLVVLRWAGGEALLNQHLFKVEPLKEVPMVFLQHALHSAIPQFWARAQGTTMKHIKRSALTEVQTILPNQALMAEFETVAGPIVRLSMDVIAQNSVLAEMRDRLLPKLVTGEIDVSELNLDELLGSAS